MLAWAVSLMLLVAAIPAQQPAAQLPSAIRAERFVKELELPTKRGDAMYGLWQLGSDAAPVLARALRDPRPEVVQSVCAVIREMGSKAALLRVHIERELAKSAGARKHALQWALHGVASENIALAKWGGSIVVVDKQGKVVVEHKNVGTPWGVQLLPNGHFLVAQLAAGVVEYDATGKKFWSCPGKIRQALRAQRLVNGNTVIVDGQKRIFEVDKKGKVVWHYNKTTSCATRLLNGHYVLVSLQDNKLVEIDEAGKELSSWDVPRHCYGLQRLPSGNTLVATRTGDRLIEYDGKGKIATETKVDTNPNAVLRLGDGTTIVGNFKGASAIDAAGKTLWQVKAQIVGGIGR
jgi:hypothetical protein